MSRYDELRARIAEQTEPNKYDSLRSRMGEAEKSGLKYDNAFETYEDRMVWGGSNSGLLTPWDDPNDPNTPTKLAQRQPWSHQVANGTVRTAANIVLGTVNQVASALDLEDYIQTDQEVGNWLSAAMQKAQDYVSEKNPIYRENPGKALDIGDSGWWFDNGFSLVESMASFAATGGILAKSLMFLSRAKRANQLANAIMGANTAKQVGNASRTVANAVMLNQAEAIMEATDVYQHVFDVQMAEHGDETKARQKAADAATTTIGVNRLNIPLNLTSANLFFRTPKATKRILENPYTKANLGRGALEGGQESIEEIVNMIASNKGKAVGTDRLYGSKEIIMDIISPEGAEAALLGFVGGMGQTALTTEGINRLNKTIDPKTGKKISVRDYNIQEYEDFKAEITKLDEYAKAAEVGSFTSAFKSAADIQKITSAIQKADEMGMKDKSAELRKLLLSNQALTSFERGTTEHLIKLYESLGQGEQKPGMEDNYKERSKKAVQYIKDMEKVYNRVQQYENPQEVYYNRAKSYTLNEEYADVKKEIGQIYSELTPIINRIADNNKVDASSITLDYLSKDKYEDENEGKIAEQIKNTPEYKDLQAAQEDLKAINKELSDLDAEYAKITEGSYQEKAKRDKEKANERWKKFLEQMSEQAEAQAKEAEAAKAKQDRIDKQKEEEKVIKDQKTKQTEEAKKVTKTLENAAVGDIVNITPEMSKKFAGKEGEITKRENGKITIKDTESGHSFSISEKVTPPQEPKPAEPVEDLSTEGGETPPLSMRDPANDPSFKQEEIGGAKVVSTVDKSGQYFTWIQEQYPLLPEYERHPVDKRNKPVTFEINENLDVLDDPKHAETLKAAVEAYKEGAFDDPVKRQLMIDFLPLNVVFRKESEGKPKIAGPLETYPINGGKKAKQNFMEHSVYLRAHIVEGLAQGYTPEQIIGSIQDQYKGVLQIDSTPQGQPERENAIQDLHHFGGDMSKVQIFMVDKFRNLVDNTGKVVRHGIGAKGELYTVIPQANGEPFYLKLNVKKISKDEAEILYEMYRQRMMDADTGINSTISDLSKELQEKIYRVLGPTAEQKAMPKDKRPYLTPLELIGKKGDTTVKDITDFLIYDNSTNTKSQVRLDGAVLRFGEEHAYRGAVELESKKNDFIKFLTEEKRHHIKYRLKQNDPSDSKIHAANRNYINYLLGTKTLNTNAVVKVPTFQGRTSIYLNHAVRLDEKVVGKPHDPNAARPVKEKPTKGTAQDIDETPTPTPTEAPKNKIDNLESKIRKEWWEAVSDMQEKVDQLTAAGVTEKTDYAKWIGMLRLKNAIQALDTEYKYRLKNAGFKNWEQATPIKEGEAEQVGIEGTAVTIKKDAKSNWNLTVKPDGKVINNNTNKEIEDEKLINKAHLKSGYVTFDKVQVDKGTYAVTSDGRVINITKGGKSNGNSLKLTSSVTKKVLAKHEELNKPAPVVKEEPKTDSALEAKIKAAIDAITTDPFEDDAFMAPVEAKGKDDNRTDNLTYLMDNNMEALITKIYDHYGVERPGNISKSGKKVVPLHEIPGTPENEAKENAERKEPKGEQPTDIEQTKQEKEINKEPEKDCGPGDAPKKMTRAEERRARENRNKRK